MANEQPMKAGTIESLADIEALHYPLYVSPKLDGIRCVTHPSRGPVSRKFLPIPNTHIRNTLLKHRSNLDGELITYRDKECTQRKDYNDVQSDVMSEAGEPYFKYHAFDTYESFDQPYSKRYMDLCTQPRFWSPVTELVPHVLIYTVIEFQKMFEQYIAEGYEGLMARSPNGPYKFGRSTLKQEWLLKYKGEWADAEGTIIDIEPMMHNANEAVEDELGYTKRSSAQANKIALPMLGRFILQTSWGEVSCGNGKGLTHALRCALWEKRNTLIGKHVTFLYQKSGMKDKPRFIKFKGIRYD